MIITFNNIEHFLAHSFQVIGIALKDAAPVVEGVTQVVDPAAVPVEQAAYAVLGCLVKAYQAGGAAIQQKFDEVGLDTYAIDAIESVVKQYPALMTVAKSL